MNLTTFRVWSQTNSIRRGKYGYAFDAGRNWSFASVFHAVKWPIIGGLFACVMWRMS